MYSIALWDGTFELICLLLLEALSLFSLFSSSALLAFLPERQHCVVDKGLGSGQASHIIYHPKWDTLRIRGHIINNATGTIGKTVNLLSGEGHVVS